MHTSSRLGLDIVDGTDNVSGYPTVDAQAKGILDNAVLVTEGTLAARPVATSVEKDRIYKATDTGQWFMSDGTNWNTMDIGLSRGAVNIATSQSTSSTTYTTLATPDQVTGIVLPTNGLLRVRYRATWQESVSGAAAADIFIGSNELKGGLPGNTAPTANPANIANAAVNTNYALASYWGGLVSANAQTSANIGAGPYGGDVTTGQALGFGWTAGLAEFWAGGPCEIFDLPAGTYAVSVQFKASSGSVTVSNRKLWVEALPFS